MYTKKLSILTNYIACYCFKVYNSLLLYKKFLQIMTKLYFYIHSINRGMQINYFVYDLVSVTKNF